MHIIIIALLSLCCTCNAEWFAHDRASFLAQHQDWGHALEHLNTSLIEHPDDPSLLYDAGVAVYKSGDYKQAEDYFKRASESPVLRLLCKKKHTLILVMHIAHSKNIKMPLLHTSMR